MAGAVRIEDFLMHLRQGFGQGLGVNPQPVQGFYLIFTRRVLEVLLISKLILLFHGAYSLSRAVNIGAALLSAPRPRKRVRIIPQDGLCFPARAAGDACRSPA